MMISLYLSYNVKNNKNLVFNTNVCVKKGVGLEEMLNRARRMLRKYIKFLSNDLHILETK